MRKLRYLLLALSAVVALSVAAPAFATHGPAGHPTGDGIEPEFIDIVPPGQPDCSDLAPDGTTWFTLTTNAPADGTVTDGVLEVDIDVKALVPDIGPLFDWESNIGVDAILVKGGPDGDFYVYDPPTEDTADTNLHSPVNPMNDKYFGLSHISFCYDVELEVEKTAVTTFDRDFDWTIEKTNEEPNPIELAPGQTYDASYDITVGLLGSTDSNHAVSGEITITNPALIAAEVTDVTDIISHDTDPDIEAVVDCNGEEAGNGLPLTIPAGDSATCTYSSDLPDGEDRTNTATAESGTDGINDGTSDPVAVTFGNPTNVTDDCVTVTDDNGTPLDTSDDTELGEVCLDDLDANDEKVFEHTITLGPYPNVCDEHTITNTASFVTDDGDTGSDTSDVTVDVQCFEEGGCSLTPGYWKTHSLEGPAPYDDNWMNLGALQEDTPFFSNGTYYEALWTAPAGNAYYILAHAYIAAQLNFLNGASIPADVQTAFNTATTKFTNYTPAQIGALSGNSQLRKQFISLAGILDAYNNGITGPGHCAENTV